ncbi:MAG: NADPH:quinone oxidoreductase family protein [Myxococcota bacterium]
MRAWQVVRHGEPAEALALNEVAPPEPGPGLLRVRVAAAALGFPDLSLCRGSYALTPALPFTPGQELCGVVTAAGPGAQAPLGSRVMAVSGFFLGHGSFAEEALALDDFCFPVPDDLADAEAAGFCIPFHTAWVALVRRAALRSGETLLVLGASGGSGSAAVQLGRALGARVVAVAGGAGKAEFCRGLGADVVVDHRSEDVAERVRAVTEGRGADVVFDAVGGDAFDAATRCIAHEGRLLLVGFASGDWGRPAPAHMVTHNYAVLGVVPSGYDRAFRREAQRELLAHRERGALRVPVDRVLSFDALPEGLTALARGRARGKWVLSGGSGG